MSKVATYTKLQSILTKLGSQVTAAETHGLLTGMLSVTQPKQETAWRKLLLESLDCSPPTKPQWDTISKAGTQIIDSFRGLKFTFNLLLPDDSVPLEERIDALGYWCRGYLSGLGLFGLSSEDLKNEVVKELISDLSQIAHISMETDSSDEDENNYLELVEFVRIAVQNIQMELQGSDQKQLLH